MNEDASQIARPSGSKRWDHLPLYRWWRKSIVGSVHHENVVVFSIIFVTSSAASRSRSAARSSCSLSKRAAASLGLVTGWVAFRAMRSIDEYNVEVLISLAVVMGGYALARQLHISGRWRWRAC